MESFSRHISRIIHGPPIVIAISLRIPSNPDAEFGAVQILDTENKDKLAEYNDICGIFSALQVINSYSNVIILGMKKDSIASELRCGQLPMLIYDILKERWDT